MTRQTFKAPRPEHTKLKKHHLEPNDAFVIPTYQRPALTNTFLRECGKGTNEIGHTLNGSSQQGEQTKRVAYGARPFPLEQTNLIQALGGVHNQPMQRVGGLLEKKRML